MTRLVVFLTLETKKKIALTNSHLPDCNAFASALRVQEEEQEEDAITADSNNANDCHPTTTAAYRGRNGGQFSTIDVELSQEHRRWARAEHKQ